MYFVLAQNLLCNWILYIVFEMDLYCNGETKTEHSTPGVVLDVQIEKKDHFAGPAGGRIGYRIQLMQDRMLLAAFATRAHCRPMFILLPTRIPESHSVELLPTELAPRLYCGLGLFYPMCKPILVFVELHEVSINLFL